MNSPHHEAAAADAVTFDTPVPNPARMWNCWIGGEDDYAADRAVAEAVTAANPAQPPAARAARRFLVQLLRDHAEAAVAVR